MISWEGCRSPRGTRYGNCVGSRVRGQKKIVTSSSKVYISYHWKAENTWCTLLLWRMASLINLKCFKMLNVSKITSELIRCFEPQCFNYCGHDYELHWFHETRAHIQCVRACVRAHYSPMTLNADMLKAFYSNSSCSNEWEFMIPRHVLPWWLQGAATCALRLCYLTINSLWT